MRGDFPKKNELFHDVSWIVLTALLMTVPFLGKASTLDEETHRFIARFLMTDPLHPFHWVRALQPFHQPAPGDYFLHPHPPLWHYGMGVWGRLVGEVLSPLSRLPGPLLYIGVGMSVWGMARRMEIHPRAAALLLLTAPVAVLAAHNTFMLELPLLAATAMAAWVSVEAGARRSFRLAALAGILAAAAALVKYPGLLAWPGFLALVWAGWKGADEEPSGEEGGPSLGGLLGTAMGVALFLFLAFEAATGAVYGRVHVFYVFTHAQEIAASPREIRVASALSALGGVALAPGCMALLALWKPGRGRGVAAWLGAILGMTVVMLSGATTGTGGAGERYSPLTLLALMLLVTSGTVGLLGAMREATTGNRYRFSLVILAFGIVLPQVLGLTFASARYLAPALPALVLLLVDGLPRGSRVWIPVSMGGGALALVLGGVDSSYSRSHQQAAEAVDRAFPPSPDQGRWICAEWGLREALEERGFTMVPPRAQPGSGTRPVVDPKPGDLLIKARVSPPEPACDRFSLEEVDRMKFQLSLPLRLMDRESRAGYYGDYWGLLPWGLSLSPLEEVIVYRVGEESLGGGKGSTP